MKKLMACLTLLALTIPVGVFAQGSDFVEVSGRVVDYQQHQPLPGSHVYVDEQLGTISDEDGYFLLSIPVSRADENLYSSYMGYKTAAKPLNEFIGGFNEIKMESGVLVLDEVVVQYDPWADFREVLIDLSALYPDKKDLMDAIAEHLEKFNPEDDKSSQVN